MPFDSEGEGTVMYKPAEIMNLQKNWRKERKTFQTLEVFTIMNDTKCQISMKYQICMFVFTNSRPLLKILIFLKRCAAIMWVWISY